jgi:AhpC/TSA antioxidant enzyme
MYAETTGCPFPIYTDPTQRLYEALGMIRTLNRGDHNPQYIHHSLLTAIARSITQGLRRLPDGDTFKSGDVKQVGGEFLFETTSDFDPGNDGEASKPNLKIKVTWCHRMANTRGHSEIEVLHHILRLDPIGDGQNKPLQSDA